MLPVEPEVPTLVVAGKDFLQASSWHHFVRIKQFQDRASNSRHLLPYLIMQAPT